MASSIKKDHRVSSLSLNQVSMKDAARLLSQTTGTPIVVSNKATGVIVDLHLENVSAQMAIDAICKASGLWYQRSEKNGMLYVMTLDEFKNTLQFSGEETVKVVPILYPSAKDVGDALAKLYVNRVIWSKPTDSSGDHYTTINRALKRMDLLSKRGTFDITDTTSTEEGSTDLDNDDDDDAMKTEAAEAMKLDRSKIDEGTLKKMFAAEKSEAMHGKLKYYELLNRPGVVFISVLPENNLLMLRSADAAAIDQMVQVIERLDKPSPQVLLEVKILSVVLNDTKERAVDFLFSSNDGKIAGGFADGMISTGGGQEILLPDVNMVVQGSGIDPKAAILNAVSNNFKTRIQLLEQNERVTQLATPNLIVSDNESSTLFIGTETTVMEKAQSTTTYTEISSGTFQPNISWSIEAPRRKIGTSLLLTPKIHADRTVTLRLLQERSSLGDQVKNTYSGGVKSSETEELYFVSQDIDLQRLVTTVVGRDRDFMVIGGLVYEEVSKETEKTPGLSEIPIIGELLFTRMQSVRQRKELLIIIRPFVMLAPGESQLLSKSYLERISQHPAARDDLPSLGVNTPNELAKPKIVNPNDPWLVRMLHKVRGWSIDDKERFAVQENLNREDRRKNHQAAIHEIENIIQKSKESEK